MASGVPSSSMIAPFPRPAWPMLAEDDGSYRTSYPEVRCWFPHKQRSQAMEVPATGGGGGADMPDSTSPPQPLFGCSRSSSSVGRSHSKVQQESKLWSETHPQKCDSGLAGPCSVFTQMKFPSVLKGLEGWPVLGLHRRGSHASRPQAAPSLAFVPASPPLDATAVEKLQAFVVRCRRLLVLTGAGISTESGIPDYRSEGVGLYARSDRRPVQHAEFLRSAAARQKYWARNFVGWPQFSSHQPNVAHQALSHWEQRGKLHWLVTQNVDALHTKAGSRRMTELHGCTHRVMCLSCGARVSRAQLQEHFEALNPMWTAEAHGVAPDGDVFLTEEQVRHFRVPSCSKCGGLLKPDVIFFGDSVCKEKVDFVYQRLEESDAVLVAGSSLQVFSAYKFALAARDRKLPIAIVNIGPTRADTLASLKLNSRCGALLPSILL